MLGKGKHRNFFVTFHDSDTHYTMPIGSYKKYTTALGEVYSRIAERKEDERNYLYDWKVDLPEDAEGECAVVIAYSYKDSDGKLFDSEYYLIYDNRKDEEWLKQTAEKARWEARIESAKHGKYSAD